MQWPHVVMWHPHGLWSGYRMPSLVSGRYPDRTNSCCRPSKLVITALYGDILLIYTIYNVYIPSSADHYSICEQLFWIIFLTDEKKDHWYMFPSWGISCSTYKFNKSFFSFRNHTLLSMIDWTASWRPKMVSNLYCTVAKL